LPRAAFGAVSAYHLAQALCRTVVRYTANGPMGQTVNANPVSEHLLYLTLYVSSAGGV
jgi:hypothetical protein